MERRFSLLGIIGALMLSENLGDVADEINLLHDLLGIPRPEGSFADGWTDKDLAMVGLARDQENSYTYAKHSGTLGCPIEGCDGQTCEEGES